MDWLCWLEKLMSVFSEYSDRIIFEPINKISYNIYKCDKHFHLDILEKMYEKDLDKSKYITIYTNGKCLDIYEIDSFNNMKKIFTNDVRLIGKFKNGGQSANRLQNIRQNNRETFLNKSVEEINEIIGYDDNIDGVLVCGPSTFKKELYQKLKYDNMDVIDLDRVEYNNDKIIEKIDYMRQNNMDKDIIEDLKYLGLKDKLVYGKEVKEYMKNHMLKNVYVHHTLFDEVNIFVDKNDFKINIIKLYSNYILDYDRIIGEKYY